VITPPVWLPHLAAGLANFPPACPPPPPGCIYEITAAEVRTICFKAKSPVLKSTSYIRMG